MTDSNRVRSVACVFLLATALVGCEPTGDSQPLGDWTLKERSLQLTEDLRVSETEEFFFGTASAVDVTSNGRIVVGDRKASNVKVLRPDGSLLDTLGGPGDGPGEFQTLTSVQVGPRDSLYAYDLRRSRLTVFAPAAPYEVNRTLTLSRETGFAVSLRVAGNALLAEYSSPISAPEEGVSRPSTRTWRWMHGSGVPGDTVLSHSGPRMATLKAGGGGFRVRTIPFEREMKMAFDPDGRVYYGWTDSLYVQARRPDGSSSVIASIPAEPVPVSEADRDSALSNVDDEMRSMVASALPDTKPAFTELIVAGDGHLWIKRPAERPSAETVPWWVLDPDAQTIRTTSLPAEVDLAVVRDDHAYGTTTTETGAPAVVRYRIDS